MLSAIGAWLTSAAVQAVLKSFFDAFGTALNDYLGRQRADQNAQELGAKNAQLDTAKNTIDAQQAELQAQADAPADAAAAIKRLEEGSA